MKQTLCSTGQVSSSGCNFLLRSVQQSPQTITDSSNFSVQPNTLQQILQAIQQKVLTKQLSLYRSFSHQKSLPGLITLFNTKSQQLIKLQAVYSKEGQVRQSQLSKVQGQKVGLESEVKELERVRFDKERDLIKVGYEREMWGREVDALEERMRVELAKESELREERTQLVRIKGQLLQGIEEEKKNIEKCSIRRAELIYEIQELQQIQLNPIHLIKQQNLQHFNYLSELLYRKSSDQQNPSSSITIHQLSSQLSNLSRKEYESQTCGSHEEQTSYLIGLVTKTRQLQHQLNELSLKVIGKSEQISIEQLKANIMSKQIQEKQQQLLKLNQLLAIAHQQPFIVSTQSQNPFTTDIPHLEAIVGDQRQQNLRLKERLRQLMAQLQNQHQTHDQLNKLRLKAKRQRQEEIKVMLQKNVEMLNNIDKRQTLCEKKMAGDQGMQKGIQIDNKNQDDYLSVGKAAEFKFELPLQKLSQKPLFIQITNQNLPNNHNQSKPKQKPLIKPQPQQNPNSIEQKLKQLRQRLTAKFQAQNKQKN